MTTGNFLNFSIESLFLGNYNVSIDGVLVAEGEYNISEIILLPFDGYSVGTHTIIIEVKSIDELNCSSFYKIVE